MSWQDLCTRSLSEVSWQDLCKRPLVKISVQDRYKSSLCKISGQALYNLLVKISALDLLDHPMSTRRNESDVTGPKWQADRPKMTRGFHGRSHKSHFVWKLTGKMPDASPGASVLCEPAQSKCTRTFQESHVVWKFKGKMPTRRIPPRLNTWP